MHGFPWATFGFWVLMGLGAAFHILTLLRPW